MFNNAIQTTALAAWITVVALFSLLVEVITGASLHAVFVLFLFPLAAVLWFSHAENRRLTANEKCTLSWALICYLAMVGVSSGILPMFVKPWLLIGLCAGITAFGWQQRSKNV